MSHPFDSTRLDAAKVGAQVYAHLAASAHNMARASTDAHGDATVTKLADWKAAHARPAAIDALRWNEAAEKITRANFNAWLTLTFIWPRVMLRAAFGV